MIAWNYARAPISCLVLQGQQMAAENALLKLEGERLRATIARLSTVEQQLRAGPPQAPTLAPAHAHTAAPVAALTPHAGEVRNAHPQPPALPALGILTADERTVLRSYFEFTNRLLPVGASLWSVPPLLPD